MYSVAFVEVGQWQLELDDVSASDSEDVELELSINGNDFDISVKLESINDLDSIADAIRTSEDKEVNVTAEERCFAHWSVANLFIFKEEARLTFLLLDSVGDQLRFRVSTPTSETEDFLKALKNLREEAEAEL